MVQRRCRARFVRRRRRRRSVVPEIGLKEFEGDLTIEPDVPREADGPHPAAAQDMQDLVRSDAAARCEHLRADYTATEFTVDSGTLGLAGHACRPLHADGTRRYDEDSPIRTECYGSGGASATVACARSSVG